MTTDLFGKPVTSAITGVQGEFPFRLPSPLDLQVQRETERWRESRCSETAEMFVDEVLQNTNSGAKP